MYANNVAYNMRLFCYKSLHFYDINNHTAEICIVYSVSQKFGIITIFYVFKISVLCCNFK